MSLFSPLNSPITDWRERRVWVIGASSGIGADTARQLLQQGARVMLSARRAPELASVANLHPNARISVLDLSDHASILAAHDALVDAWGGIDLVLIVAGGYSEMRATQFNLSSALQLVDLNVNGVLRCLAVVLPTLLSQGRGGIGIVSSVAGFRGLPKALIYGPTKAALINLAECLYLDLHTKGINVHLIDPGFVATPLTAKNDFSMPGLMTSPAAAAALIQGVERGQFHIHFPRSFTNWMRLFRLFPYKIYFWLIRKATRL